MHISHAVIASEPNVVELPVVGAHPPASISVRDARAMLAGLEKVTHRLTGSPARWPKPLIFTAGSPMNCAARAPIA
ncbi:hypothetical protein [Burkholderia sp. Bp9143]|uniref:hypothetical protein n=1 Tax=Burkholderia sp. Bp9143 TaxID=2184574 RepID=UPI000F5B3E4F|nr:hypothetical protein [Burkholderia sp. Bp9143]